MSIQSSINQGLTIAGALYTQTPGYQVKKEEALRNKEIAVGEAQYDKADKELKNKEVELEVEQNADEHNQARIEGYEAEIKALKENQQKLNDKLLGLGSDKALTRSGREAAEGEANAIPKFTDTRPEAIKRAAARKEMSLDQLLQAETNLKVKGKALTVGDLTKNNPKGLEAVKKQLGVK